MFVYVHACMYALKPACIWQDKSKLIRKQLVEDSSLLSSDWFWGLNSCFYLSGSNEFLRQCHSIRLVWLQNCYILILVCTEIIGRWHKAWLRLRGIILRRTRSRNLSDKVIFFPNLTNVMLHCSLSLMSVKKKFNLTYLITLKKNVLIAINNYLQLLCAYACTWMQVSAVARGIRSPLDWNYSQKWMPE